MSKAPFVLFAAGHAEDEGRLEPHVRDYRRLLDALVHDQVDLAHAAVGNTLSDQLSKCILAPLEDA